MPCSSTRAEMNGIGGMPDVSGELCSSLPSWRHHRRIAAEVIACLSTPFVGEPVPVGGPVVGAEFPHPGENRAVVEQVVGEIIGRRTRPRRRSRGPREIMGRSWKSSSWETVCRSMSVFRHHAAAAFRGPDLKKNKPRRLSWASVASSMRWGVGMR